ncbi:MAG: hypothetical protein QXD69_05700, partial [Candidatus Bathyarchaeia archaeon]
MKDRILLKHIVMSTLILLSLTSLYSKVGSPDGNYLVWVTLYLREYGTDIPIENISLSITIATSSGTLKQGPWKSDETGKIDVFLGEFSIRALSTLPRVVELSLTGDYLLIKVGEVFIEDIDDLDA